MVGAARSRLSRDSVSYAAMVGGGSAVRPPAHHAPAPPDASGSSAAYLNHHDSTVARSEVNAAHADTDARNGLCRDPSASGGVNGLAAGFDPSGRADRELSVNHERTVEVDRFDATTWSTDDLLALERQLMLRTAEPICLDPCPMVFCVQTVQRYNRLKVAALPLLPHRAYYRQARQLHAAMAGFPIDYRARSRLALLASLARNRWDRAEAGDDGGAIARADGSAPTTQPGADAGAAHANGPLSNFSGAPAVPSGPRRDVSLTMPPAPHHPAFVDPHTPTVVRILQFQPRSTAPATPHAPSLASMRPTPSAGTVGGGQVDIRLWPSGIFDAMVKTDAGSTDAGNLLPCSAVWYVIGRLRAALVA